MTKREFDELWEKAARLRRRVDSAKASRRFELVKHRKFQDALEQHWQVDQDGNAMVQTVCWLFCWAVTGINSRRTADECRDIFNSMFDFDKDKDAYTWFLNNVGHEAAREFRYYRDKPKILDL